MRSKTLQQRIRKAAVIAIAAIGLAGCRATNIAEPLSAEMSSSDPDAQMEFWHTLPQRRIASNDAAFHALLLFVDGSDPATDYPGRVDAMKARGMLPKDFNGPAERAVQRGTVAVAIARMLEIKGGLSMRLFGSSPRYAVRELQYMNLFPQSSPQQTFSGQELLGIIGRAEDYQRQFNENALAEGKADNAAAPPRGPARGDAEVSAPESPAPDSEPQQP
jgi:hypothetical protein